MINAVLMLLGSLALCLVSYFQDRQNREAWAFQQQTLQHARASAVSEKLNALLHTLCTAVVHVRGEQLSPLDAVEDLFGEGVATLRDLPTQDAQENPRDEITGLVDEVRASGGPAKRKLITELIKESDAMP